MSVRPVVARVPDDFSPTLNIDEVEDCFYCPLEGFLSGGEGYSYRDWEFVEVGGCTSSRIQLDP